MKYIKQLDSLRALAIFTVIIVHWFPKESFWYILSEKVNAPTIFFTFSGFLITSILLKDRFKAEYIGEGKLLVFKNFLLKRMLRLFPGYFLVLAIFYFFPPQTTEVINFKYFISFTTNIYINKMQKWPALAHLWSMSVEEQFYLFCPWVLLYTYKRYIPFAMAAVIYVSIISQKLYNGNDYAGVLTINCLDGLAIGSLLGWFAVVKPDVLREHFKLITCVALTLFLLIISQLLFNASAIVNTSTLISILAAWGIAFFLVRDDNKGYFFYFLLENKALMKIGKLSYGLYLYHFLIPYYTYPWFAKLNDLIKIPRNLAENKYLWIAQNFCLLIIVSMISNQYFEQPIMNFKKYLLTKKRKATISTVQREVLAVGRDTIYDYYKR